MMSFSIVADSCCDLTDELGRAPYFRSVPLIIHVNDQDFVDDQSLNIRTLANAMAQAQGPSSTSCPSPMEYLEAFQEAQGDIYVVTLSALLSGSHNSAWQAKQIFLEDEPERNIHVFNSCSASAGEVALVYRLAKLAGYGLEFQEVVRRADAFISEMNTLFVLENLDNLRKNGRLTKVQSLITSALNMKLVMGSTPEGEICKHGQALSIKQALSKTVDLMAADPKHKGKTLFISHCLCPERAEFLGSMALKQCSFSEIVIAKTRGLSTFYANTGGVVAAY